MRIQLGLITVLLFWISSAATSQAQQITLTGSEWLLEDLGGSGVLDRIEATLTFPSADKVSGNGSCNRFFGPAQIDGEKIELGPLGSTRMSCPEAVMNQETEYLNALQASEHWEWKSPYLLLYTKGLTKPLRFTRKQVDDSHPASAASERDLTQLFGRIWKLTVTTPEASVQRHLHLSGKRNAARNFVQREVSGCHLDDRQRSAIGVTRCGRRPTRFHSGYHRADRSFAASAARSSTQQGHARHRTETSRTGIPLPVRAEVTRVTASLHPKSGPD